MSKKEKNILDQCESFTMIELATEDLISLAKAIGIIEEIYTLDENEYSDEITSGNIVWN